MGWVVVDFSFDVLIGWCFCLDNVKEGNQQTHRVVEKPAPEASSTAQQRLDLLWVFLVLFEFYVFLIFDIEY